MQCSTSGAWTPSTEYKNDEQYIDVITNGGSSYACKTTHTSGTIFSDANWNLIAQKGDKGDKGDNGVTPIIKAGAATSLASTASPTVTATTNGNTTTFNFGIPKGDISDIKTPTFDDGVGTYTTLSAANTAAETASNAIKSKVSIFTTLSNVKKSFSAIVQGLKILATNVGAINGITDSLTSTSSNVAASAAAVKALNDKTTQLNGNLANITNYDIDNVVAIGKWIDGRVIYRKCVRIGALPNTGFIRFQTNIPTTAMIINLNGKYTRPMDDTFFPINFSNQIVTNIGMDTTVFISVQTIADRSNITDNIVWIDYVL